MRRTLDAREFDIVSSAVKSACGVVLSPGSLELVSHRMWVFAESLAKTTRIEDLLLALKRPESDAGRAVVESVLNHETTFFRDAHVFDAIRTDVLPDLIERRRSKRQLDILVAACATGQEAYSLAMLIHAGFPQLSAWKVSIVASDVSRAALRYAREARYSQHEVNRGLPASYLVRYFSKDRGAYTVAPHIRRSVVFSEQNLLGDWSQLPRLDIVLMRNALIYFDTGAKRTALAGARSVLRRDGYLFLGATEAALGTVDALSFVRIGRTGVFRHEASESAGG